MASGDPPVELSRLRTVACAGLLLFGFVVGSVVALSQAPGTATTLLGLLFGLMGGSLVSLFANPRLTERDRYLLGAAVGLISVGIVVGLGVGFALKKLEAGAVAHNPEGKGNPVIAIHSHEQLKVTRVKQACKSVLDKLPKDDPNYPKFERLYQYLDYTESLQANLDEISEILKSNNERYERDAFKSKFEDFRKEIAGQR